MATYNNHNGMTYLQCDVVEVGSATFVNTFACNGIIMQMGGDITLFMFKKNAMVSIKYWIIIFQETLVSLSKSPLLKQSL